jgi:hypothetical protein
MEEYLSYLNTFSKTYHYGEKQDHHNHKKYGREREHDRERHRDKDYSKKKKPRRDYKDLDEPETSLPHSTGGTRQLISYDDL